MEDAYQAELAELFCIFYANNSSVVSQLKREWYGEENWNLELEQDSVQKLWNHGFGKIDFVNCLNDETMQSFMQLLESQEFQKVKNHTFLDRIAKKIRNKKVLQQDKVAVWHRVGRIILLDYFSKAVGKTSQSDREGYSKIATKIAHSFFLTGEIRRLAFHVQIPILLTLSGSSQRTHKKSLRVYIKSGDFLKYQDMYPSLYDEFMKTYNRQSK